MTTIVKTESIGGVKGRYNFTLQSGYNAEMKEFFYKIENHPASDPILILATDAMDSPRPSKAVTATARLYWKALDDKQLVFPLTRYNETIEPGMSVYLTAKYSGSIEQGVYGLTLSKNGQVILAAPSVSYMPTAKSDPH